MSKYWNKSLHNRELAREKVYECVKCHRHAGYKTLAALDKIAPYLGISRRKLHSMFFNETVAPMAPPERHMIVVGTVKAHLWLAARLHELANEIEEKAHRDDKEESERWQTDVLSREPVA